MSSATVCIPRRKNKGRHWVAPLHSDIQVRARNFGLDNLAPIIWYKIANGATETVGNGSGYYGKPYQPNGVIKNDVEYILFLFKNRNPSAITIAIVGVNHATSYSSYEGERVFAVEGARSPAAEAPKAIKRLDAGARHDYDEFIVLPFQATNSAPFPFEWVDFVSTENLYSATLIRARKAFAARSNRALHPRPRCDMSC